MTYVINLNHFLFIHKGVQLLTAHCPLPRAITFIDIMQNDTKITFSTLNMQSERIILVQQLFIQINYKFESSIHPLLLISKIIVSISRKYVSILFYYKSWQVFGRRVVEAITYMWTRTPLHVIYFFFKCNLIWRVVAWTSFIE